MIRRLLLPCLAAVLTPPAIADAGLADPVVVCAARATDTHPPAPDAAGCARQGLWTVDPQGRHLWLLLSVAAPAATDGRPFGLQISAKAASRAYLNGVLLGENGEPADDAGSERVGRMDAILPIPPGALRPGDNAIAVRMSAHHGLLHLAAPIHALGIVPYARAQDRLLRYYLPTLMPLGAFVLACFYFASITLRSERRTVPALLGALSLLAAVQLLAEISRGLVAYPYPVHAVRLLAIFASAFGVATCLLAIVVLRFAPAHARARIGAAAVLAMVAGAVLLPGMDAKTGVVLWLASAVAAGIAALAWARRVPHAGAHALALGAFGAVALAAPDLFLDRYFYFLVAALLVFLMVQQALAFAREQRRQRDQRARADRLQAVLDERAHATEQDVVLVVPGAVALRRVRASEIAHVQGAGDYSELHLANGESVLHSTGLNALEQALPAYFLRVHRSHLVNTRLVERLHPVDGGSGLLHLSNGARVPVSRRIMPGVRKALR